jgi:hypothetical protein
MTENGGVKDFIEGLKDIDDIEVQEVGGLVERPVPTEALDLGGLVIQVPKSDMTPPTDRAEKIWKQMQDREGWKNPTKVFTTKDPDLAKEVAYCLDWYVGGHEFEYHPRRKTYTLSSEGYYHYVGA